MDQLIKIGNQEIATKEFKGQRVVTFKDIDLVHERPDGTAGRNYSDNKKRFLKDVDYFEISRNEVGTNFVETYGFGNTAPKGILITEQGYLMLVKSFTDDLAWQVQRDLANTYFKVKKPLSVEEMMRIQLSMVDNVVDRVDKLENTMNIDYGQQQILKKLVNASVVKSLGGIGAPAYKEIKGKVFSECNNDIQDYFNVNSRCNIPRVKFEEACNYIKKWRPCTNTRCNIDICNEQLCLA